MLLTGLTGVRLWPEIVSFQGPASPQILGCPARQQIALFLAHLQVKTSLADPRCVGRRCASRWQAHPRSVRLYVSAQPSSSQNRLAIGRARDGMASTAAVGAKLCLAPQRGAAIVTHTD